MAAPPITERHKHHWHRLSPIKEPVRCAATANVTIASGLNVGDVVDGVTLVDGDRVLLPVQSAGAENGIYVAGAAPARAYDLNAEDAGFGFVVEVIEGTVNAGTFWKNRNTATPTIDTTALTFSQVSSGGASDGMVPYHISSGETFTVPIDRQALWKQAIHVDAGGTLTVRGSLLMVT